MSLPISADERHHIEDWLDGLRIKVQRDHPITYDDLHFTYARHQRLRWNPETLPAAPCPQIEMVVLRAYEWAAPAGKYRQWVACNTMDGEPVVWGRVFQRA